MFGPARSSPSSAEIAASASGEATRRARGFGASSRRSVLPLRATVTRRTRRMRSSILIVT